MASVVAEVHWLSRNRPIESRFMIIASLDLTLDRDFEIFFRDARNTNGGDTIHGMLIVALAIEVLKQLTAPPYCPALDTNRHLL